MKTDDDTSSDVDGTTRTIEVDGSEPPAPPPVEVAVVPTEVAPLPSGTTVETPTEDRSAKD